MEVRKNEETYFMSYILCLISYKTFMFYIYIHTQKISLGSSFNAKISLICIKQAKSCKPRLKQLGLIF